MRRRRIRRRPLYFMISKIIGIRVARVKEEFLSISAASTRPFVPCPIIRAMIAKLRSRRDGGHLPGSLFLDLPSMIRAPIYEYNHIDHFCEFCSLQLLLSLLFLLERARNALDTVVLLKSSSSDSCHHDPDNRDHIMIDSTV